MLRVNFYIDGFNFYHPLANYQERTRNCLKWLNYYSLCQSLLGKEQKIGTVYFFTAIREDLKEKSKRHKIFIKALKVCGVQVVKGKFKKEDKNYMCSECKTSREFNRYVEKRTDVNIASYLIRDAFEDNFDKAFLFSADSDLVTPIKMVTDEPLHKQIQIAALKDYRDRGFYFPRVGDLVNASKSDFHGIEFADLKQHLLPVELKGSKDEIIKMPKEYVGKAAPIDCNQ